MINMLRLRQGDTRWSKIRIGKSGTTLAQSGCLLTSLCILYSKFYRANYIMPDMLARGLAFTSSGDLIWKATDQHGIQLLKQYGMEFIKREYNYFPNRDNPVIKFYSNSPDYAVALEVRTRNGRRHWLACAGKSVLGFACIDPFTSKFEWKTVGVGAPYSYVTGYAIMKKYSGDIAKFNG